MQRHDSAIQDSENMIQLIENGRLQLSAKVLIARMTEVIADMNKVREAAPDYEQERVSNNLARAYWYRAECYFDDRQFLEAQNDYIQVDKLRPGESEVKALIKECQKALKNIGPPLFTKAPPKGVHTPKAQRHSNQEENVTPPQQKKYVELGGNGSSFMRHKEPPKSPRQKLPTGTHHRLNQPGGKGGNHNGK